MTIYGWRGGIEVVVNRGLWIHPTSPADPAGGQIAQKDAIQKEGQSSIAFSRESGHGGKKVQEIQRLVGQSFLASRLEENQILPTGGHMLKEQLEVGVITDFSFFREFYAEIKTQSRDDEIDVRVWLAEVGLNIDAK